MKFSVSIYQEFNDDLYQLWKSIEKDSDHYVFQCYDWVYQWYQIIGKNYLNINICIVVLKKSNQPVALFPFGIRKYFGTRVLEFLGGDQSDYHSPLISREYSNESSIKDIWGIVNRSLPRHDIKQFIKIPEYLNDCINPVLNIWQCKISNEAFSSILPNTWHLYLEDIPKKIKNDSLRQMRRLNEDREVKFLIGIDNDDEYDKYLLEMFSQKSERYKLTGARDLFAIDEIKLFYKKLNHNFKTNGNVHLSVMLVDDIVVSTHWGVIYNNRYYFLLPTYDSSNQWNKYSTGRLLQEKLLEWSINEGIK